MAENFLRRVFRRYGFADAFAGNGIIANGQLRCPVNVVNSVPGYSLFVDCSFVFGSFHIIRLSHGKFKLTNSE